LESEIVRRELIVRVPDIGETFTIADKYSTHRYRVTGWMRQSRRRSLIAGTFGPDNVQLEWCIRDAAEYITGYGVCGIIRRVGDVQVDGRVSWAPAVLAEEKAQALRLVGERLY
jgi:hypothetical protein